MALALRKLKRILEERFPPPDKVDLRDEDGIIGVVTSKRFRRLDTMQRQDLLHDLLATTLSPEERRRVLVIVAVTPEEEIANPGRRAVDAPAGLGHRGSNCFGNRRKTRTWMNRPYWSVPTGPYWSSWM
jgi:hypothetical protein